MKMIEGDLEFDFSGVLSSIKFDGPEHRLSHCMKAVDFILETNDAYYFIEVKDPDHPDANEGNKTRFVGDLQSGKLIKNLTGKYRDTFIYRWAEESLDKPVHYIILLCLKSLSAAALLPQQESLQRSIPLTGSGSWKCPIVQSCLILSIDAWNSHFKPWSVARVSDSAM